MHDHYRSTDQGDFQTLVNTFTQGLRELPTDYVTRVKNFLAEYLGSPRHPVPFGGRVRDFEHLDAWLADTQASPYLLLAAPAGRGKSALLLHWCRRLLARRDVAVVYFPVSIRFRTNLAGVTFPSLVALLARLHGEKVPSDPNMHEEVWRGLFAEYITRPLPDGRSLLLVLDGVDEAADWIIGPDLFPLEPPPGLRVVLSARYLANDQDADAWLQRLGWTRQGLARTLELYPLDRTGIASVLTQMGFPLDLLGTRVNIVSELYRLSEGDPLLVRLYVDDLWERGEAAVRFQPEDLRAIRPGLAGYFERWWREQRLLWSAEAPQREAAAQIVLNLLAGALGPLSKDDLLSLAPDEASLRSGDLEQHVAPLARFVTGDGVHQGYVFSHPRLGNYFLEERLSELERQEVERRFLVWGERTLAALNDGRLAPEHASSYIVQYYGAHLERAQAGVHSLLALVSNGWRRAWEKLDRANAGFLSDVERAWRAAEREDRSASSAGGPLPYLRDEIRCLLSQVSVNSVTSNISPRLMLEAVKTGIWTPAQGLACIRLITDLAPRARELVGLAPYVQEPLRTDILQEALDTLATIKDEYARLDALVELAPGFSEELLWQVLDIIPSIEDEADRAGVLAELAPALSPYKDLLERALDLAQEMEEGEYRGLALEGLAPCLSADQHDRVLQLVSNIEEDRYRAPVLTALIPHLAENMLQGVLQEARSMQDGLSRIRLLTDLVLHLSTSLKDAVMQEVLELERDIEDREYRVEVLVKLAPFLPEDRLQQALQEIQLLWDESYRARALSDILQYTPENLLPELQQGVLTMRSEEYRTQVLLQLFPRLSKELLEQTLDTVQATWDEGRRAELLAQLAPYAPDAMLPRLVEIANTIRDRGYRVWLLAELEAPLAGKLHGRTYSDMLTVFKGIRSRDEQLQTLLAITPRLSDDALSTLFSLMLPEIFGFMWRLQSEEDCAHILSKLAGRLPEDWLSKALEAARGLGDESYQMQALVALAPRIRGTLLSEALDVVRAIKDREKRSQVLVALVSSLPEERKGERVQEMLQVLQVIKDETERAYLVAACAPYLPEKLSSASAQMVIEAVQAMLYPENQAHILNALFSRIPEDLFETVLKMVQNVHNEEQQAQILEALAPHVPQRLFLHLLRMTEALQHEARRARVLTTLATYVPENMLMTMLEMIRDSKSVELWNALIEHAPESAFDLLWEAVQAIPYKGRHMLIMGTLARHMPEGFFPQFWEAIQADSSDEWQWWALRQLLPHMSERLFQQLWEAVQGIDDEEQRMRIQPLLMPYVPEQFFYKVWSVVREIPEEMVRGSLMENLAFRVPEEFFPEFFMGAQAISQQRVRMLVLKALIPRIPEDFFPQFLTAVQSIPYEMAAVLVLEVLIPYVPERFFPQLWETVQLVQDQKLLANLAPRVPRSFLSQFWAVVRTMKDIRTRTQILTVLLPYLMQDRPEEALEMVQEVPYGEQRIEVLEKLFPHLSEEQRIWFLDATMPLEQLAEASSLTTWEKNWRLRPLAVLVPYIPEERQPLTVHALLKATRALRVGEDQTWLLTRLAPHVPEAMLDEMLDAISSITMYHYQRQVWEVLLPTLSQSGWTTMLDLIMAQMRKAGDASFALQMLKAAGSLSLHPLTAQIYPVLHEILRLLAQHERRDALPDLALLASIIRQLGGEEAVTAMSDATLEVGTWWP